MRRPPTRGILWALAVFPLLAGGAPRAVAQEACPGIANEEADAGWTAYRQNRMDDAETAFTAARVAVARRAWRAYRSG